MTNDTIPAIERPAAALEQVTAAFGPAAIDGTPIVALEVGAHLVALAGIVALALLGGGLLIRNRVTEPGVSNAEAEPTVDEEFMTDRERVQRLVRSNGGRMKQSEIVDAVDWSKAKVSRLLADLEDDGEITKLRLGRENLICLRGQEPPASKSSERPGSG